MSRYLQFILAFLHLLFTWILCATILRIYFPPAAFMAWLLLCWTAAWWRAPFVRLFMNIRKPLADERKTLLPLVRDICQRCGDTRRYQLLVAETPGIGAFAFGTNMIAVHKKCITELNTEQLGGILAHEIGHHQSRDTITLYCASTCSYFPLKLLALIRRHSALRWLFACLLIIASAVIFKSAATPDPPPGVLLGARMIVAVFLLLCWNLLFAFVYKMNDRYTEYRQDAHAQACGYGTGLINVLKSFITEEYSDVRPWSVIRFGSHPLTHNRIVRLEELEGLE